MIYNLCKSNDIKNAYFCIWPRVSLTYFIKLKLKFNHIEQCPQKYEDEILRFTFTDQADEAFFQLFYNAETKTYDVDL